MLPYESLRETLRDSAYAFIEAKKEVLFSWQPDCVCISNNDNFPCKDCPQKLVFEDKIRAYLTNIQMSKAIDSPTETLCGKS
jgi:hypothetical protein